jgi:serine/threonine-protein kinase
VDDRYEVVERLGSGGTSSVWRAIDRGDGDRAVAVKILHLRGVDSVEALRRFEREARALERLSSPNIVTLRGHGSHEGRPFMVLDLVDGEDLGLASDAEGPCRPPWPRRSPRGSRAGWPSRTPTASSTGTSNPATCS